MIQEEELENIWCMFEVKPNDCFEFARSFSEQGLHSFDVQTNAVQCNRMTLLKKKRNEAFKKTIKCVCDSLKGFKTTNRGLQMK